MRVAYDRGWHRRIFDFPFDDWECEEKQRAQDDSDNDSGMLPAQVYCIIQSIDQQAGTRHEGGHAIVIKSTGRIPVKVWDDQDAQHTGNPGKNEVHPEH